MNNPTRPATGNAEARPPVGGQLVIPVAAVLFTLYYLTTIIESPWTAQVSAVLIGGVLIALCLIFIAKKGYQVFRRQATLGLSELYNAQDLTSGRAALFTITLGYIILIEWGGFTITTFFFLFLSMLVLNRGKRKAKAAIVSLFMALGGYALFILAFDTRFPRGPFEILMKAVIEYGN